MKKLLLSCAIIASLTQVSYAALTTNLVAYYKLDESSGNPADATGNSRTLTNNGTTGYIAALINNGGNQGAANSTKYFSRSDSLSVGTANASIWSYNIWTKQYSDPAASGIFSFMGFIGSGQKQLDTYYFNNAGTFFLRFNEFNGATGEQLDFALGSALSHSSFEMISVVKNGTSVTAYRNCVSLGTQTILQADGDPARGPLYGMGRAVFDVGGFNSAIFDEVGIWTRALSVAELCQLYNGGVGLPYPLSVNTNFLFFFSLNLIRMRELTLRTMT